MRENRQIWSYLSIYHSTVPAFVCSLAEWFSDIVMTSEMQKGSILYKNNLHW